MPTSQIFEGDPTVPPGRRKIELSDTVREAWEEQLKQSAEAAKRAEQSHKMTVYLANKAGLTYDEISKVLGVSSSVVGNWKAEIEAARGEDRRGRALRPTERGAYG